MLSQAAWAASTLPATLAFSTALADPERAQRRILGEFLVRHQHTRLGRRLGFDRIRCAEEFADRVPLHDYETLRPDIDDMARGAPDVLVPGRPTRFEPTSGSTAAGRLIPSTPASRRELQNAVDPWLFSLMSHEPRLLGGRHYWSVSPPAFARRFTEGGVPIGFDDDTAYLSPLARHLAARVLAVPAEVATVPDMETSRYLTLLYLLAARDLVLVSVWNPTFLLLLLDAAKAWSDRLIRDLAEGVPRPPGKEVGQRLRFRPAPGRWRDVEKPLARGDWMGVWPHLRHLSCWADGAARGPAVTLGSLFPGVILRPKGLLATEGVVSIPFGRGPGALLAVNSHFFEFLSLPSEKPLPAWKLELGARYEVVLTTGGGLTRYRLGDLVEVVGFSGPVPRLTFLGRGRQVSDFYGEKLHEPHVAEVLETLWSRHGRPGFAVLVPKGDPPLRYTLVVGTHGTVDVARLASELDQLLEDNVHYRTCRRLGQLGAPTVTLARGGPLEASRRYEQEALARGRRAGGLKPPLLEKDPSWETVFSG